MTRALRIAGNACMAIGCVIGLPFIIAGAMLHAAADSRKRV